MPEETNIKSEEKEITKPVILYEAP